MSLTEAVLKLLLGDYELPGWSWFPGCFLGVCAPIFYMVVYVCAVIMCISGIVCVKDKELGGWTYVFVSALAACTLATMTLATTRANVELNYIFLTHAMR